MEPAKSVCCTIGSGCFGALLPTSALRMMSTKAEVDASAAAVSQQVEMLALRELRT